MRMRTKVVFKDCVRMQENLYKSTCTSTCRCIMVVTITIKDEAFRFLKEQKKDGMSYSDVILGLKKNTKSNPLAIAGMLKEAGVEYNHKAREEFRKEFERRFAPRK